MAIHRPPCASTASPSGVPSAGPNVIRSAPAPIAPLARSYPNTRTRGSGSPESMKYMASAAGLHPIPFDSVTAPSITVMVPSPSSRYRAPAPGRRSRATVPAQNRPAGSTAPSLKRRSAPIPGGRTGPVPARPPALTPPPLPRPPRSAGTRRPRPARTRRGAGEPPRRPARPARDRSPPGRARRRGSTGGPARPGCRPRSGCARPAPRPAARPARPRPPGRPPSARSPAHPQRQALDQVPLEDQVDHDGRHRADERARHQDRDAGRPARRQGGQPDRDGALPGLQEQQPDQQVVPDLDELQHRHRGDGRQRQRQRDAQERPLVAQAVHHRGLDQLVGDPAVVGGHQERRERRAQRRVDQDRAQVGVDQPELGQVHVLRDDDRLQRHHQGRHHQQEHHLAAPVVQLGEGEAGHAGHGHDDRDRRRAHDGRAEQLAADRQLAEQLRPARDRVAVLLLELGLVPEGVVEHVPERVEHHDGHDGHQDEDPPVPRPPPPPRAGPGPGLSPGLRLRLRLGRHRHHPSPSSDRISRSWTRPTTIMMTNRMIPYSAPVPNWPWAKPDWYTKNSSVVVPSPGPPPVITKIRLNSAENALITVITNENWMNRRSSGSVTRKNTCRRVSPSTRAASVSVGSRVAIPVRKMIVLVPSMDQMNVMASAVSALPCPARALVCTDPRPTSASRWFSIPFSAKNWTDTIPMTTHEIAVGRKYTDRKKRQPSTCSCSRAATPSGMPMANGMHSSSSPLFSRTRQKIGSDSAVAYVPGPIQVDV